MDREYVIKQMGIYCPTHEIKASFDGRTWSSNLLQDVGGPLKIADVHGLGHLSCGCEVEIDWYATDPLPQVHHV